MLKTCLVRLVDRRADLKRAIDRENVPLVRQVLSQISAVLDEVGLHDDGTRDIEWRPDELQPAPIRIYSWHGRWTCCRRSTSGSNRSGSSWKR